MLGEWGARWAFGPPRPSQLDPIILLWWIRWRVVVNRILRPRVVIQFEFRHAPQRSYWLLIEPSDVSVCLKDPGFDVDVIVVSADIKIFYEVWLGRLSLLNAVRKNLVRLDGAPANIRAFPRWFALSSMAETVRASLVDRRTAPHRVSSRPESEDEVVTDHAGLGERPRPTVKRALQPLGVAPAGT